MARQANKHRRDIRFVVGDLVWLKTANLSLPASLRKKLAPRWVGPFPATQVISATSYKLDLPPAWRLHPVFHVLLLKPTQGSARPMEQAVFDTEQGK